jgi:tryptophan synthase alpha subunit
MQRVTPQNLDQLASAFGSSLQDLLPVMASGFLYLQNVTGVTVNATELVVAVADIVDTIGKTAASTKKQGLQVSVRLPL